MRAEHAGVSKVENGCLQTLPLNATKIHNEFNITDLMWKHILALLCFELLLWIEILQTRFFLKKL